MDTRSRTDAQAVTPPALGGEAAARAAGPFRQAAEMFCKNRAAVLGLALLCIIVAVSLAGPFFLSADPFEIAGAPMTPPLEDGHLLGTDYVGRDILTGIVHGGRATLAVALAATLCNLLIGFSVGALAGYYQGAPNTLLMKITEFFQVLPPLLFAMVLVSLFSPSIGMIAVAIGLVTWPSLARLTRGEFMRIRELEYVTAAQLIGAGHCRVITRVMLPNALPPIIVNATLNVGSAVLYEAGLSFLGLGDPNVMSWGLLIGASRDYIFDAWWAVTLPGLVIFLTSLSICLVGDGLTTALNPKLRKL